MLLKDVLTETTRTYVGKRLELLRLALGKSHFQIAGDLGWSPRKWRQWENGKRLPNVPDMIDLAERYGVTLDYIYRGDMTRIPEWMAREIRETFSPSPTVKPHSLRRNNRVRLLTQWRTDENHRLTLNSFLDDIRRDDLGRGVIYSVSPIGRTRWELSGGDPDTPLWRAHIADLDARKPFKNFRYPLITRAGRPVWTITTGHPVYEDGIFAGYAGTVRFMAARNEHQHDAA
jgi:transcriptional regulator with XRE-family HTH domain